MGLRLLFQPSSAPILRFFLLVSSVKQSKTVKKLINKYLPKRYVDYGKSQTTHTPSPVFELNGHLHHPRSQVTREHQLPQSPGQDVTPVVAEQLQPAKDCDGALCHHSVQPHLLYHHLAHCCHCQGQGISCNLPPLQDLYFSRTWRQTGKTLADPSHPWAPTFGDISLWQKAPVHWD